MRPVYVSFITLFLIATMTLSPPGKTQITKSGGGYLFRVKYLKGQQVDYTFQVTSTPIGGAGGLTVSMPIAGVVTDVTRGISTLQVVTGPMTMGGKKISQPSQQMIVKFDSRGRMVSGTIPGGQNLTITLPERPMRIGASSSFSQMMNLNSMPMKEVGVYRFVGFKTVRGRQVARLNFTLSGKGVGLKVQNSSGTFTTSGSGMVDIAVADGLTMHLVVEQILKVPVGSSLQAVRSVTRMDRK